MPKKLTPEQKAQRREESLARQRAWRARCKERADALKAGEQELEQRFGPTLQAILDEQNALFAEWQEQDRRHQQEQAELRARQDQEIEAMRARREAMREKTDPVWKKKREAHRQLNLRLAERFPDLEGNARWSSVCWTPPNKESA